jgi:hypothetical protein
MEAAVMKLIEAMNADDPERTWTRYATSIHQRIIHQVIARDLDDPKKLLKPMGTLIGLAMTVKWLIDCAPTPLPDEIEQLYRDVDRFLGEFIDNVEVEIRPAPASRAPGGKLH